LLASSPLSRAEFVALLESSPLPAGALTAPLLPAFVELVLSDPWDGIGTVGELLPASVESAGSFACANAPVAASAPAARKVAAILRMFIVFPPLGADGGHRAAICPWAVTLRKTYTFV
jgi:hypothetical protein